MLPPFVSAVSFARVAALAGGAVGHPRQPPPPDTLLAAYVSQVLRRLPPPWRYTCLRRSLVLFHLLRRAGCPVALHIGVRKQDGALQAHAWLVLAGEPYLEPDSNEHRDFRVIAAFPEPARN